MKEKIFKIKLKYQNKEYECEGYCWQEEDGEWRSAYEYDGVRNCEHDYGTLLPDGVADDIDFSCDQKEIEIVDYWFEDKKN